MSTLRSYGAWFSLVMRFYKHFAPTRLMEPVGIMCFGSADSHEESLGKKIAACAHGFAL
jgi:hypothetical protein